MLWAGERADEKLEPDGKRERLVGLLAAERHELFGPSLSAQYVAMRDSAHGDVGHDRPPVTRGNRDRQRIRARQGWTSVRMWQPPRGGRSENRHEPTAGQPPRPVAECPGREAPS